MTVLLMLFTLIVFLVADHVVQRSRRAKRATVPVMQRRHATIPMLALPDGVSLALNHLWVRQDDAGEVTLGIDEFVPRFTGLIDSITLPGIGDLVTPEAAEITLKQGEKGLAFSSPVFGKVTDVNKEVLQQPSMAAQDPYGKGWLVKVKPRQDRTSYQHFLVSRPLEWLKEQYRDAKEFFASRNDGLQLVMMQDGGESVDGLLQRYDNKTWEAFQHSFVTLHKHATVERVKGQ
jgi:glycine cleavage system H protein